MFDQRTGAITGADPLAVLPMSDIKTNASFKGTVDTVQYDWAAIHVPGNILAPYGSFAMDQNYPGGTVNITGYPGLPVAPPPGTPGLNVNTQFNISEP